MASCFAFTPVKPVAFDVGVTVVAANAGKTLFTTTPGKDLEPVAAARTIIEPFTYRAFRRPPRPHEVDALLNK